MKKLHKAHAFQVPPLALVLGLASCMAAPTDNGVKPGSSDPGANPNGTDGSNDGGDPSAESDDPFDIDAFLGVPITGCASGFAPLTSTLALTANAPTVITAPGGKIAVNGIVCLGTVGGVANTELTTANVAKITVAGSGDDKVILDMLAGSFGTKIFAATGGITVALGTGDDKFMIRGTTAADTFKIAKSSTTTDTYYELSGDKVADVKVTFGGTLAVSVATGPLNDTFTASPLAADITSFAGAAVVVTTFAGAVNVFGGDGNDTITGGAGDDVLRGSAGDDTFRMAATDDGSDTYVGDAGVDTVDYSNRTAALAVDIGPATPTLFGDVDLSTIDYSTGGDLDGLTLKIDLDGAGAEDTVTFADPISPTDVVAQINTELAATVAYLTGQNYLALTTASAVADDGQVTLSDGTANSALGFEDDADTVAVADADDGLSGEADDVQNTIENVTGGTGNDVIFGDSVRNVLKGGDGADTLGGGGNTSFASAAVADSLMGEAGDDTFYMPSANYFAVIAGGTGTDTINYSGREADLTLTNQGTVGDGAASENGNIGTDVEKMVGGFGDDTLLGGTANDILEGGAGDDVVSGAAGDDTLIAGLGDDTYNGGVGTDIMDYSAYTTDLTITLCVSATATGAPAGCTTADDGDADEDDEVASMEWVKGGDGDDTITASTIGATLEGGDGADVLTGGAAIDALWGDAGDDELNGMAGDDSLEGNAGDDELIGGDGDDVCVEDADDLTDPPVSCEL